MGSPAPPHPLFLRPAGKDYLWGGNRLNDDFSRDIGMTPLAETWECSTHPDGLSTVADRDCIFVPADSVASLIHG